MLKHHSARRWFIKTALAYLGTPYIWEGDDPSGFDCSGFVVESLKSVGLLKESEDYTAEGLLRRFCDRAVLTTPCKGGLLFYQNQTGAIFHVAICLDRQFQLAALGGGRGTTESSKSWKDNAFIKIRPIPRNLERLVIVDPFVVITLVTGKK